MRSSRLQTAIVVGIAVVAAFVSLVQPTNAEFSDSDSGKTTTTIYIPAPTPVTTDEGKQ